MWHHIKTLLVALIVLAITGLSGLMIFAHVKGESLLSVQTTSMVPTLKKGTLVSVTRIPSDKLRVGDIVTYRSLKNPKETITHRVVETPNRANNFQFLTKGDANAVHDAPIPASAILGKVKSSVPYAGFVTDFLRQPLGLLIIIYVPALLIIIDEIIRLNKYYAEQAMRLTYYLMPGHRARLVTASHGSHKLVGSFSFLLIAGLLVGSFIVLPVSAQLNSQARLTGNTIMTATLNQPPGGGTTGGNTNTNCSSNTNVNFTNTSTQTATTGNAATTGNTTGGTATSGSASNSNNTNVNVSVSGC